MTTSRMGPAARRTRGRRRGAAARWLPWILGALAVALSALLAVRGERAEDAAGAKAQQAGTAPGSNGREGAHRPLEPAGDGGPAPGAEDPRAASRVAGGGPIDVEALWESVAGTGVSREDLQAALSDSVPGATGASGRQAARVDGLVRSSMEDPAFAGGLLRALRADPAADERLQWGIALAIVEPAGLADTLTSLTASPDAATRAAAYELVRELPLPAEQLSAVGSRLLAAAVESEGLAAGLAALRQASSLSGEGGAELATGALVAYANDPDPLVRSEGILSLGQAGDSPYLEPALLSGLAASDPLVQLAAIEAVVASPLRSPELKDELLRLGLDGDAQFEVRAFAVNAAEEFPLTAQEQRLIAEVRRALE